jgi:tripartite-type tricarboxylate transporter receptor subunit TctC
VAPEVPTLAEGGVRDVRFISWVGFLTTAGTPAAVVNKLNAAMVAALRQPSVQQTLANAGASEIFASTPEEFAAFIKRERAQWAAVIKATGATAN